MKLSPAQIDGFCANPPAKTRAVLLYGPDQGLVFERTEQLSGVLAPDPDDPFQVVSMDGQQAGWDMAGFLDEALQIPLDSTRRVIRVRDAGDWMTEALTEFLASEADVAVVLVQGGNLGTRSSLRKLCETSEFAVAAPCYLDDGRDVKQLLTVMQQSHGIRIEADVVGYLVERLGRDRTVTRSELEKIALFAGEGGILDYEAAAVLVGDSAQLGADTLADAAGLGQAGEAFRSLQRLLEDGLSEIAILRRLLRHFQSLHVMAAAPNPLEAVESSQPPIFWKRKPAVRRQAGKWSVRRIEHVLRLLVRAEQMCMRTGIPGEQVLQETLLRILLAATR